MKNTLGDLNNHLFAQLERLGEEDLTTEELEKEMDRTKAITQVSTQIINNASLVLRAKIQAEESISYGAELPKMLEG